jgi:hypothetical protein
MNKKIIATYLLHICHLLKPFNQCNSSFLILLSCLAPWPLSIKTPSQTKQHHQTCVQSKTSQPTWIIENKSKSWALLANNKQSRKITLQQKHKLHTTFNHPQSCQKPHNQHELLKIKTKVEHYLQTTNKVENKHYNKSTSFTPPSTTHNLVIFCFQQLSTLYHPLGFHPIINCHIQLFSS